MPCSACSRSPALIASSLISRAWRRPSRKRPPPDRTDRMAIGEPMADLKGSPAPAESAREPADRGWVARRLDLPQGRVDTHPGWRAGRGPDLPMFRPGLRGYLVPRPGTTDRGIARPDPARPDPY